MHLCQLFFIDHLPAISQHQWTTEAKERLLLKGTKSPASRMGSQTAKNNCLLYISGRTLPYGFW